LKTLESTDAVEPQKRAAADRENALSIYLKEISSIPLLTDKEVEEYSRLSKTEDKAAKEELIKANLRFVVHVAKKYQNMGLPMLDLISEGNIGLMNAIEKFDATKGWKITSYAVWWIKQSIIKAINEKSQMIRLPVNLNVT
jgi:RNA polymerase primary sigma factor